MYCTTVVAYNTNYPRSVCFNAPATHNRDLHSSLAPATCFFFRRTLMASSASRRRTHTVLPRSLSTASIRSSHQPNPQRSTLDSIMCAQWYYVYASSIPTHGYTRSHSGTTSLSYFRSSSGSGQTTTLFEQGLQ